MWSGSRRRSVSLSQSTGLRSGVLGFLIQLMMETWTAVSPDQGWLETASVMTPPWLTT